MRFFCAAHWARPHVLRGWPCLAVAAFYVTVIAAGDPGVARAEPLAEPVTDADAAAPIVIDEIRFSGNKVTRPETMLQEMTVRAGTPASRSDVEASRQAIMNLGIFKEVRAEVTPIAGRTVLTITVVEKRYLLPLPRINRNADGDISYGAQLRWDNAFGRNQQIKTTYEDTQAASGDASESSEISGEFSWPRVNGSPYGMTFGTRWEQRLVDANREGFPGTVYDLDTKSVGFSVSRLLKTGGPSTGWSVHTGLSWNRNVYDNLGPIPASVHASRQLVGWQLGAGFSDVRDYLYSRAGEEYGYGLDLGVPTLGSDIFYYLHNIYLRKYTLITERPHVSLDYQLKFGIGSVEESNGLGNYALGGASTLRGYPRDSINGNAFVLGNIEYRQPLFGLKELRGVVFFDAGNAYISGSDIDLLDLKTSIGIGLRYNVTTFVKVQLRLDYGYALNSGDSKAYGGSDESF